MKNSSYLFLAIVCALNLSSCASFSNKISKKESIKLTKKNIQDNTHVNYPIAIV